MNPGEWTISTRSSSGACVEVLNTGVEIVVRNSNCRHGGTVTFTHREWHAFVAGVKLDEFDL